MAQQVIAVDIDDVLADQAEAFLEFSNKTWGTNFNVHDYTEHWMDLWGVDIAEVEARSDIYHDSGTIATFRHKSEALPVLQRLKKDYSLVIVTSRRRRIETITVDWINRHFPDIFDAIHFAGFFDDLDTKRWHLTKAEIVADLGANYLIDDQLKHCVATAQSGIDTVLFGNYKWNQSNDLPPLVTRCDSWQEVERYFHDKRRVQA